MNTTKIKSCSCRSCKAGRHYVRKDEERRARRHWNLLTRQLAGEGDEPTTKLGHFGGRYSD